MDDYVNCIMCRMVIGYNLGRNTQNAATDDEVPTFELTMESHMYTLDLELRFQIIYCPLEESLLTLS